MQLERRFVDYSDPEAPKIELRAAEDGTSRISGYFAVYSRWSPVYGKFREQIAPGFFDPAIGRDDVRALFNHDESRLLGRNRAGTLRMQSDNNGLYGEISPVPNTPTGQEVSENLRLGNLTGASFAFTLPPDGGDSWRKGADGVWERTLNQVGELFDVSVVTSPFYPQTDVGMRAEHRDLERSFTVWAAAHPEEIETRDDRALLALMQQRLRLAEVV